MKLTIIFLYPSGFLVSTNMNHGPFRQEGIYRQDLRELKDKAALRCSTPEMVSILYFMLLKTSETGEPGSEMAEEEVSAIARTTAKRLPQSCSLPPFLLGYRPLLLSI